MPEVKKLRRKKPSDYKLVQFRSDASTKAHLDRRVEKLLAMAKKDLRFKKFRKNDMYITCLQLGSMYLEQLLKGGDKSSAELDRLTSYILMRREVQFASTRKTELSM